MNWVRLEQEIAEPTPCDKDKYDCTTLFGSFCELVYECRVNLMTGHEKKVDFEMQHVNIDNKTF